MSHPDPRRRRPSSAPVALLLASVVLAAACGSSTPSASPSSAAPPTALPTPVQTPATSPSASPDADAIYDAVEQQVVAIRGLQPSRPVARQFIDQAVLRTTLTAEFDKETPPAYLAGEQRLYKALGLIPVDADLRTLELNLLSSGVAAFYRSDEGKLYVVSKTGQPGPAERFYFAHEYDHALQDQNSTIFKDQQGILDQGDRSLARAAIYEGDATLLMVQWAAANLSQADLLAVVASGSDPTAQAIVAGTPAILRDTLTFPYTTGLQYVTAVQSSGGWPAVNAYFTKMPASTEQVIHPEKYTAGEAPIDVSLPKDLATQLGTGWTVPLQDTFGELQLKIWLSGAGVGADDATAAAAGWGGDRLAVMAGPAGAWAVAIDTEWDTPKDATEFDTAATLALAKASGKAQVLPGVGGTTRWILVASDAATAGRVAGALGLAG